MKKILLSLFLFTGIAQAQLPNVKLIGAVGQNYKFDNGLQINDTLLPLGPIKVSAITTVGGATDSVLSRNHTTGFVELRPQGLSITGTDTGATSQAQEFRNGVTVSSSDYVYFSTGQSSIVNTGSLSIEDWTNDGLVTISANTGTIQVSNSFNTTLSELDKDGTIKGINIIHPSNLNTPADAIKINGVKCYRALLNQASTGAPTATVLENTLGLTPTFTYVNPGQYTLNAASATFTSGKTFVIINDIGGTARDQFFFIRAHKIDSQNIGITTYAPDFAGATSPRANDILANTEIQILVYP